MMNWQKVICVISDVQIWSALIWASVIIGCSYVSNNNEVSMILITAAGFHVVLLGAQAKKKSHALMQVD